MDRYTHVTGAGLARLAAATRLAQVGNRSPCIGRAACGRALLICFHLTLNANMDNGDHQYCQGPAAHSLIYMR
ncbi:MAG: hypothetical protein V7642_2249 [Burkholderiales bacterium]|jgi:hypothetical protein